MFSTARTSLVGGLEAESSCLLASSSYYWDRHNAIDRTHLWTATSYISMALGVIQYMCPGWINSSWPHSEGTEGPEQRVLLNCVSPAPDHQRNLGGRKLSPRPYICQYRPLIQTDSSNMILVSNHTCKHFSVIVNPWGLELPSLTQIHQYDHWFFPPTSTSKLICDKWKFDLSSI